VIVATELGAEVGGGDVVGFLVEEGVGLAVEALGAGLGDEALEVAGGGGGIRVGVLSQRSEGGAQRTQRKAGERGWALAWLCGLGSGWAR
jgi:hypothetical protein